MDAHPQRAALLTEAHARPFRPIAGPRRLIHFAFTTDERQASADRASLNAWCSLLGLAGPGAELRHFRVDLDGVGLVWEQHSEFTTYTWDFDPATEASARVRRTWTAQQPQPGPLLVCVDLEIGRWSDEIVADQFRTSPLAMSLMDGGAALVASDFHVDDEGFVRLVVADRGLSPERGGALVQRLLELETYRVFALLSLPEARRLGPEVAAIESELVQIASAMPQVEGLERNHNLLQRLIGLAARLEAATAESMYRFAAGRAYSEIVQGRLIALREEQIPGCSTFSSFMSRRLAPAMRTCSTMEERLAGLSRRIARAAQLLRTRVDIELERQNRDLLASLDTRTRLQLRLQQTVELLSVAATTYYLAGLADHLLQGLKHLGLSVDAEFLTAAAIPPIVIAVAAIFLRHRASPEAAVGETEGRL